MDEAELQKPLVDLLKEFDELDSKMVEKSEEQKQRGMSYLEKQHMQRIDKLISLIRRK